MNHGPLTLKKCNHGILELITLYHRLKNLILGKLKDFYQKVPSFTYPCWIEERSVNEHQLYHWMYRITWNIIDDRIIIIYWLWNIWKTFENLILMGACIKDKIVHISEVRWCFNTHMHCVIFRQTKESYLFKHLSLLYDKNFKVLSSF
jgi:hypothetical protein